MKVLVTGAKGQLGTDLMNELAKRGIEGIGVDVQEMDITDAEACRRVIKNSGADAVIHCAAYTAVDAAEDNADLCRRINGEGTRNVAQACKEADIKLMYISTDYVFDGQGTRPWEPDDERHPLNVYGQTKYEGELAVEELSDKYFIVRIAWVFGVAGKNFIKTMLRLGKERGAVSVVDDQIGSPTYTYDLARLLVDMIQTDKYGRYHATNEGLCSWYEFAKERMKSMYDGYHFCEFAKGVFNPFSVLNVFDGYKFDNYWFQTGTPTFLVHILQKTKYDLRTLLNGIEAPSSVFSEYRVDSNNPIPLIYQSGYLTIKGFNERFRSYLLEFPNDEVRYGFINFLVPFYTGVINDDQGFYIGKFVNELESGDYDAFLTRLQAFFADFPYELNEQTERHYQVVFYLVFKLMGQFTQVEVQSARGRADAVVKTPQYIYVFEFKLHDTAEAALKQIDEKDYLIPYQADGREVIKLGVEFSAEKRNINRWLTVMS